MPVFLSLRSASVGFVLAAKNPGSEPQASLLFELRYLDARTLRDLFYSPPLLHLVEASPNRLKSQTLIHDYVREDSPRWL